MSTPSTILTIRDLRTHFNTPEGLVRAVDGVSFELREGETYALVGESGSGKSMTALSVMQLVPRPAGFIAGGSITFEGRELVGLPPVEMRGIRGNDISMIFQEPMTALNPVFTIGNQLVEVIKLHQGLRGDKAERVALDMLDHVGIADPDQRLRDFPHQLSGGMRQRVMIAMALACRPKILIADEPTTALDVTIQSQILELMAALQSDLGTAILLITHNMGVVAENADRIGVMLDGKLVEEAPPDKLFASPQHDYTKLLLDAVPSMAGPTPHSELNTQNQELLQVSNLKQHFPIRKGLFQRAVGHVRAVDGLDIDIRRGETFAIVGESGCGKTTVGKCINRLVDPTTGSIRFDGHELADLKRKGLQPFRQRIQMIFQDPFSSLNPRMRIGATIVEGMRTHGIGMPADRTSRAAAMLERVGMEGDILDRYPHEFSGGQRQRIGIARALAVEPDLVICDEATSSLDVSVQAKILDLLDDLKAEFGLSYLFISHDIAVVRQVSDRIAVMYLGQIVETGPTRDVIDEPQHPYTRALISAVPRIEKDGRKRIVLPGDVPSPANPPSGCRFHPRCPHAVNACRQMMPALETTDNRRIACLRSGEI
ncbi:MAG: ABC transporter ATP-binding protein [Kiritimatiellia bacterium]|jgi:oligopeptide/dipeptide ABC transporter ATP-binding protein|nr:ABC transporter ATP-binding protein [Kiritimatiellia bacterium]MDP6629658.1 ABC transporter ATP-binding protein [Kiritimatiellia bacterium]MDP6811102.1 ABC transporter ATP-binding protein [Kiritimatiellia bacterium]MDP7024437.1 ABC transporter ATP-binding protein [Kiritimatiellia bacterium]